MTIDQSISNLSNEELIKEYKNEYKAHANITSREDQLFYEISKRCLVHLLD